MIHNLDNQQNYIFCRRFNNSFSSLVRKIVKVLIDTWHPFYFIYFFYSLSQRPSGFTNTRFQFLGMRGRSPLYSTSSSLSQHKFTIQLIKCEIYIDCGSNVPWPPGNEQGIPRLFGVSVFFPNKNKKQSQWPI